MHDSVLSSLSLSVEIKQNRESGKVKGRITEAAGGGGVGNGPAIHHQRITRD